jgi:hypothetical protein
VPNNESSPVDELIEKAETDEAPLFAVYKNEPDLSTTMLVGPAPVAIEFTIVKLPVVRSIEAELIVDVPLFVIYAKSPFLEKAILLGLLAVITVPKADKTPVILIYRIHRNCISRTICNISKITCWMN